VAERLGDTDQQIGEVVDGHALVALRELIAQQVCHIPGEAVLQLAAPCREVRSAISPSCRRKARWKGVSRTAAIHPSSVQATSSAPDPTASARERSSARLARSQLIAPMSWSRLPTHLLIVIRLTPSSVASADISMR
jgi:hypothetical protein